MIYKKKVEIVKIYVLFCYNFIEIIYFYYLIGILDVLIYIFKII